MRKFKFFLNFEKEANWLNQMAEEGFEFVGKSMGYHFRPAKPEKTDIKIDYRTFKNKEDFIDYCTLFEDCGWKHIAGTKSSGTQYFKKVRADADEDIFSDADSKAGRYKRLSQMYMALSMCYLPIFAALITTGAIDAAGLLSPKRLYYTPGLWNMAGADFWGAFLFETPFALFRAATWALFPVIIILFLFFSYKTEQHYKKLMK
ncbi:DUF2812 domain-containing protein [Neobacillus rhizophilus]|uniref:DUF2812 domain-containing protein n=1 Tax=Neobacillus rhizophilus TaxID=2833579 RepID=A0A942UBL6_9BACI|nr:DUF2812 domain-containing protein [Neobacillus rhizophilus]MBS4214359.1 DUF2812 domain-containing protein [Neobacillus rhizophilus]MBU8915848.1 DUF2812 domain-containing protein [Bacillus sp. FJAT-29953]